MGPSSAGTPIAYSSSTSRFSATSSVGEGSPSCPSPGRSPSGIAADGMIAPRVVASMPTTSASRHVAAKGAKPRSFHVCQPCLHIEPPAQFAPVRTGESKAEASGAASTCLREAPKIHSWDVCGSHARACTRRALSLSASFGEWGAWNPLDRLHTRIARGFSPGECGSRPSHRAPRECRRRIVSAARRGVMAHRSGRGHLRVRERRSFSSTRSALSRGAEAR